MTTRHVGYVVTLRENIRDDDAGRVITALSMVSGVVSVKPITNDDAIACEVGAERIKEKVRDSLFRVLRDL